MGILSRFILSIALNALAFFALIQLVDGIEYGGGVKFFVLIGILLSVINGIVKPIIKALAFPVILLSGGLFLVVINIGVLVFLEYFIRVADFRDLTLTFHSWENYVIGALVFGVINWLEHIFFKKN